MAWTDLTGHGVHTPYTLTDGISVIVLQGLLDKQKLNEGVMYAAGAFDCDDPLDSDNLRLDSGAGPGGGSGRGGGGGRGRGGGGGRGRGGGGGRGRGGGGGRGRGGGGGRGRGGGGEGEGWTCEGEEAFC